MLQSNQEFGRNNSIRGSFGRLARKAEMDGRSLISGNAMFLFVKVMGRIAGSIGMELYAYPTVWKNRFAGLFPATFPTADYSWTRVLFEADALALFASSSRWCSICLPDFCRYQSRYAMPIIRMSEPTASMYMIPSLSVSRFGRQEIRPATLPCPKAYPERGLLP